MRIPGGGGVSGLLQCKQLERSENINNVSMKLLVDQGLK